MSERQERLEEALLRIKQWAEAYPVNKVFAPVSEGDLKFAARLLDQHGLNIGAIHASWARHILDGISEIVDAALKEP